MRFGDDAPVEEGLKPRDLHVFLRVSELGCRRGGWGCGVVASRVAVALRRGGVRRVAVALGRGGVRRVALALGRGGVRRVAEALGRGGVRRPPDCFAVVEHGLGDGGLDLPRLGNPNPKQV